MDLRQAELCYQQLKSQLELGGLGKDAFQVEVAKLLLRDDRGVFWMLDEEGTWFCNRGAGWVLGDPHSADPSGFAQASKPRSRRLRPGWAVALGMLLVIVLVGAGALAVWQWSESRGEPTPAAAAPGSPVRVLIASPADGSQVALDQEVAIELTIDAEAGLQAVDHVALVVDGQEVTSLAVQPKIQPGQTSLPLSQPWLPSTSGEHQVTVIARSGSDESLGEATIRLQVAEIPDEPLSEPACVPDATFVEEVTIPAGSAFPPGARMDKVWQVRNSGSCAWGVGYELALLGGASLDAPNAVPVPRTAAGETADLTVTFWAPEEAGPYASTWQLQAPDGQFFGPTLLLEIQVEAQARQDLPPNAPDDLQATVTEDGKGVTLTWNDRSNNEDAFRINREDMEASIGLAPADSQLFVDHNVACGNIYFYTVIAFNAAGASPSTQTVEASLPPCAPTDDPPSLALTVVPTQVRASEVFTITFLAGDEMGVDTVVIWGEETGEPRLDLGRIITCAETFCIGDWPLTATGKVWGRLTVIGVARDTSGQQSEQERTSIVILREE